MLDDIHWSATSALIDEACGMQGNSLFVGDDVRVLYAGAYYRGEHREDYEREYPHRLHTPLTNACHVSGNYPTVAWCTLPELYTEQELKTSPTYNDALPRVTPRMA